MRGASVIYTNRYSVDAHKHHLLMAEKSAWSTNMKENLGFFLACLRLVYGSTNELKAKYSAKNIAKNAESNNIKATQPKWWLNLSIE